jgi:hypothetical protein
MAAETEPAMSGSAIIPNTTAALPVREKIDLTNIPRDKRHLYAPKVIGVEGNSKLKLQKPLTKKARRIVAKKTKELIEHRNQLDRPTTGYPATTCFGDRRRWRHERQGTFEFEREC